ncbi:hypothetical protein A3709_10605 [Halioglobus sp. HI00S01]|uniref:hypothetical protein n=1 Tax=Halioglobus sp. HI00S01 TaxID=1822214 RepID=UPI0007C3536D|nr:hypothetical protein [Halioglobus sp. HI00S01]KZX51270.1 hypothetical protein A3709_10605 [Halioglobus sp. HI00S01]
MDNVSIAHSAGAGYSAAYNFDFTSVDTTSGTDTAVAAEAGVAGDGDSRAAFDPRPVPLPSLWLVPLVIALGGLAARRNRRR